MLRRLFVSTIIANVSTDNVLLIVLSLDLEEALCVVANRADFRSFLADDDVSAVSALPNAVAVL